MTEHPTAGPAENAISAEVSNAVLRLLSGRAMEAGTLIGAAAVMTGAMDGLVRYACASQTTAATPDEVVELITAGLATFVSAHHQAPRGAA